MTSGVGEGSSNIAPTRVLLLDMDAHPGPHGASDVQTQREFGKIMGFISNYTNEIDDSRQFLTNNQVKIIAAAVSHTFVESLARTSDRGTDCYYVQEELDNALMLPGRPIPRCGCDGHTALDEAQCLHERTDLRNIIRTPRKLLDDAGKVFGTSLIQLILRLHTSGGVT